MSDLEITLAEAMDAHRVPENMDAAFARVRERMFAPAVVAGQTVGRYVLIETIGSGGMGAVVRAYDPRLQREVALKRLRATKGDMRGRLLREARAMAKLRHPNVVSVYDVELIGEELVIAMEYVRGDDLRDWLKHNPDPDAILDAFFQAGRGLDAAHVAGLVHRDFKPANVLIDGRGRVQVTDFGLVRDAAETTSPTSDSRPSSDTRLDALPVDETAADIALGTPRFMAPEQERGEPVDRRADVYAFSVALWEALAGAPPFQGDSLNDLRLNKLTRPPAWPKHVAVRAGVRRALERGMLPNPDARWASMPELLSALAPPTRARHRWWWMLPVGAAAIGVAVAARAPADPVCDVDMRSRWATDRAEVRAHLTQVDQAPSEGVTDGGLATLDRYVEGWQARHAEACDADAPSAELDLACLRLGRARFDAVLGMLATVESDEIPRVPRLLARLPDLSQCAEPESAVAKNSVVGPVERRINDMLSTAYDLYALGRAEESLRESQAAMEQAKLAGLQSQQLDARLHTVAALIDQRRMDEGMAALRETLSEALGSGETRMAARAASLLGGLFATRGSRVQEGIMLTQLALDMQPAADDNASWRAAQYSNASLALLNAGQADEATEYALRALEISEEGELTRTMQHVQLLEFGSSALCQAGEYEQGIVLADESVELLRGLAGDDSPKLGEPLSNRGLCLSNLGDVEGSIADHREALEIFEAAYGPDDERVGTVLDNLGALLAEHGDPIEAEAMMRRSLAIKTALYDADHLQRSYALSGLAYALQAQGRLLEAERHLEEALSLRVAHVGTENTMVFFDHLGLARIALDQGRIESAVDHLEEAERIAEATLDPDASALDDLDAVRRALWTR